MAEEFPPCNSAGEQLSPTLRSCHSPRILGLGRVEPDDCRSCLYREDRQPPAAAPLPRRRLVPCFWQGDRLDSSDRFHCRHTSHSLTTPEQCGSCEDYLFPVLSPRMSVREVLLHRLHPLVTPPEGWWQWDNVQQAQRELAREFLQTGPAYSGHNAERGIIVVGGGKYLPSAYVTCRVLRHLGCRLPIELWHLEGELLGAEELFNGLGVTFCNADEWTARAPFRFLEQNWWKGWQLKAYALLHSRFEQVLLLDADCYPLRNPEFLFDCRPFRRHGAVFWPDLETSLCLLTPQMAAVFGLPPFRDQPTESGQLLLNRRSCWRELSLAGHFNEQADFAYRIIWGDKDTYPIAWKLLKRKYARLWPRSQPLHEGIYQYDHKGKPLFLHRCTGKFSFEGTRFDSTPGQHGAGFNFDLPLERFCQSALQEFQAAFSRLADRMPS